MEHGKGLLGALVFFGLDAIDGHEKQAMRDLVLAGGPWSVSERADILDYCESDVVGLEKLLPAMLPHIDLPRALLRGRYMAAGAAMEFNGVPMDVETLQRLRDALDRYPGRPDRCHRCRLWRVRRPHVQDEQV